MDFHHVFIAIVQILPNAPNFGLSARIQARVLAIIGARLGRFCPKAEKLHLSPSKTV
jgi:hypothetical protein